MELSSHHRTGSESGLPLTNPSESSYRLFGHGTDERSLWQRDSKKTLWILLGLASVAIIALGVALARVRSSTSPAPNSTPTNDALQKLAADIDSTRDTNLDPCDDFYQYACGKWLKETQIPDSEFRWSRSFSAIDKRNELILRSIAESNWPVIGTMWKSCMDLDRIENAGMAPIKGVLDNIHYIASSSDITSPQFWTLMGDLRRLYGISTFFELTLAIDAEKPSQYMIYLFQGGFSLPDRSYYFENPDRLSKYQQHITNMLTLSGQDASSATTDAQSVLQFEKSIAQISFAPADLRDPNATYNALTLDELQTLAASVQFSAFFNGSHVDPVRLNVQKKEFFASLSSLLTQTSMSTIIAYLKWQVLHRTSSQLSAAFRDENFAFFEQILKGVKTPIEREKKCVGIINGLMGEISGRYFIQSAFSGDSITKSRELIRDIKEAFRSNLPSVDFLDDATRKAAETKLDQVFDLVGAPDNWTDYSSVYIEPDTYFTNLERLIIFNHDLTFSRIHKPADKTIWEMAASEVNAYYSPEKNSINFPAGIIQPPFFYKDWPRASNLGGIGMVMGHELTHGFDDQGSQYDGSGRLTNWWSTASGQQFKERAQCMIDQYSNVTVFQSSNPTDHINGRLTTGENVADNGGIKLAWLAYKSTTPLSSDKRHSAFSSATNEPLPPTQPPITSDELFFLSFAQTWCTLIRPESLHRQIVTDPHSPAFARVNVPLQNFEQFHHTYNCPPGSKMNPTKQCKIW